MRGHPCHPPATVEKMQGVQVCRFLKPVAFLCLPGDEQNGDYAVVSVCLLEEGSQLFPHLLMCDRHVPATLYTCGEAESGPVAEYVGF